MDSNPHASSTIHLAGGLAGAVGLGLDRGAGALAWGLGAVLAAGLALG
jgi:hypothetical protein